MPTSGRGQGTHNNIDGVSFLFTYVRGGYTNAIF